MTPTADEESDKGIHSAIFYFGVGNSALTLASFSATATLATPQQWFVGAWPLQSTDEGDLEGNGDVGLTARVVPIYGLFTNPLVPTEQDDVPQTFTATYPYNALSHQSYLNDILMPNVQVAQTYDSTGDLVASYTYGTERIAESQAGQIYLLDGRGSVTQTHDGAEVTSTLTYDAFGVPVEGVGDSEAYFGYNAEEYDPQTELVYLRARYYAPGAASFITQDTELGSAGHIDSANRYSFAETDPVNNADPTGHVIGSSSYERTMEAAGGINEIYNFNVAQMLTNSYNQATAAFNLTLGLAQGTSYTSMAAINSIAYISQAQANGYINAGAAAAFSVGSWYGCSPGAITMGAVNLFASDVQTAKDTTNVRIANVQANKVSQYNQYQAWLAEQAWLAQQAAATAASISASRLNAMRLSRLTRMEAQLYQTHTKPVKPAPSTNTTFVGPYSPAWYAANMPSSNPTVSSPISWDFGGSITSANHLGYAVDISEIINRSSSYITDGFAVYPNGSYANVLGARTPSALNQNILGTRYASSNMSQYSQVFRFIDPATAARNALNFRSAGSVLGYVGVALNTGFNIYDNVQSGASTQKIVVDATVDIGFGIGGLAASAVTGAAIGAAFGTVVPGLGNIVGAAAGFLIGVGIFALTESLQINGRSVVDWTKYGVNTVFDAAVSPQNSSASWARYGSMAWM